MKRVALPWGTVHAYAGTAEANGKFVPRTPFVSGAEVGFVRWVFEVMAMQTNMRMKFGYQTADSESAHDTPVALGTAATTDGFNRGSWNDVQAALTNKALVRFGYWVWNSDSSTLVCSAAGGYVEYKPGC